MEFNIAGNAPVDSPTSIISTDICGKTFVSSKLFASPWPSRTPRIEVSIPRDIRRLCIDSAEVSSDGTSDRPPESNVDNMRENTATWYFSQMSPRKGVLILTWSIWVERASLFTHRHKKNPTTITTTSVYRK